MNFNHLPVARKLWGLVLGLLVSMLLLLAGLLAYSAQLDDEAARIVQANEDRISLALRWKGLTTLAVDQSVSALASADETLASGLQKKAKQGIEAINALQKQVEAVAFSAEDKAQMERVAAARKVVLDALAEATKARAEGDFARTLTLVDSKLLPAVERYVGEQDAFVQLQERQRDAAKQEAQALRQRAMWMGAGIAAVVVVLGLVLANLLVGSITHPLERAVGLADAIAGGDLTQDVHDDRRDELGHLLRSLSAMGARLRGVVGEVRSGVESVSAASSQIATGNHDLSARTEQTAANLEETAASMEELTATVTQSADTARQANQLAANAAQAAERDRWHCLPDQHPGAERRRGSRTRGRTRPRLCRGGGRSAQPGAAQRRGRQGDQAAHHHQRGQRAIGLGPGGAGRAEHAGHRAQRAPRERPDRRDHRFVHRAARRHRPGEPGGGEPGPDDAAKCRAGGRVQRRRRRHA